MSRAMRLGRAFVTAIVGVGLLASAVLAASPSPGTGGDPRSAGEGPGLIGDPVFAVVAVVIVGLTTLLVTLGYIRLTGGRRS